MKIRKTIETGLSNFKQIVGNNHYFVDKTSLIYNFFTQGTYISLMPRPKRFGKTLNLSMIEHFFDIQKPESAELFSEFEIAKNKEFCEKHQNQYPVINISLKKIKEPTWDDCLELFKEAISELYENFDFLLDSDKIRDYNKNKFEKIILRTAGIADYKSSLQKLSKYLRKHFGKKVIILVDEYDTPIINAYKNTPAPIKSPKGETSYYENVINFMQSFLGDAFKGNDENLQKGLITGVMRVARESIFSDWNNFTVYGITSRYFSDRFGFTQTETEKLLTYFGLQDRIKDVRKWYDGYKFGDVENIYNPWSIVNYIIKEKDGFVSYWVNSGDDSLIKERITEPNIKERVQDLIAGGTIKKTIRENFVFADFEHKTELLWTLLFHNGFLTQVKSLDRNQYELKIPNYELRFVFSDFILDWIENEYKFNQDLLITTSRNLINNNLEEFDKGFRQIIGDTLSYFDTAEKTIEQEQIFHVYTLGLLAILSDDYIIKSNRESGHGRYDIALIPRNTEHNGVVIEIKKTQAQKENEKRSDFIERLNAEIENARQQIERKKYYKELLSHNIAPEKIIHVPVVFAGKEPYIIRLKNT